MAFHLRLYDVTARTPEPVGDIAKGVIKGAGLPTELVSAANVLDRECAFTEDSIHWLQEESAPVFR
jgi:hypothetical protein